jgi:DNA-directed RNA polymerase subunit M/transcription elongation factor TFIIS
MVMWKARKCPKCNGDMYVDVDEDTWFDHCLQCGYMRALLKIKCPQCGEDIIVNTENNDSTTYCNHCGHTVELTHLIS